MITELDDGELSREMACLAEGRSGVLERAGRDAEGLADRARGRSAEIDAVIEDGVCCASSLEENCEQCDGGSVAGPVPSAVVTVPGGPALGRVIGSFRSASNRSQDPALATAFDELAARLARTPRRLVRRIAFPAAVAATEDYIALGRPISGEQSPVLILSAVPREQLPPPTIQDEERWLQAAAAWRSMFRGEVVQPPP
ncbi:MAG: hypothetical protein GWM92_08425 [Gemmatimonadetes bacterium]|nr:hypothetical protein [Gemmatimonadota bacterium]NIR78675.1 hypothetical protein [Gemmatimonadota bacterium]NIU31140.1 hypothetical protein [Gemmatimonadota bacterium]NIU35866.1 hypothetical protein [Gemmatimonadota bacterium]NIV82795.1 hypothetical protein [Gemmatimonadota bacterium]